MGTGLLVSAGLLCVPDLPLIWDLESRGQGPHLLAPHSAFRVARGCCVPPPRLAAQISPSLEPQMLMEVFQNQSRAEALWKQRCRPQRFWGPCCSETARGPRQDSLPAGGLEPDTWSSLALSISTPKQRPCASG